MIDYSKCEDLAAEQTEANRDSWTKNTLSDRSELVKCINDWLATGPTTSDVEHLADIVMGKTDGSLYRLTESIKAHVKSLAEYNVKDVSPDEILAAEGDAAYDRARDEAV